MFEFVTHGLLFAFISSLFWVVGIGQRTTRGYLLVAAIGFVIGGIVSFFREKEIVSRSKEGAGKLKIFWEAVPILILIGFGLFIFWGFAFPKR